jgi:hypothetical protein
MTSQEATPITGTTLIGYFESPEAALNSVKDLRGLGFREDQIGIAQASLSGVVDALTGDARNEPGRSGRTIVTVRPEGRWAEARRVLGQDGGDEAALHPGSAIHDAVDRATGAK